MQLDRDIQQQHGVNNKQSESSRCIMIHVQIQWVYTICRSPRYFIFPIFAAENQHRETTTKPFIPNTTSPGSICGPAVIDAFEPRRSAKFEAGLRIVMARLTMTEALHRVTTCK